MARRNRARLEKFEVGLPFGLGSAEWSADEREAQAAWELYVELATRISLQPLKKEDGLLREAFNSLYSLFPTTRQILRQAGPAVGGSIPSVGGLAIAVLNQGVRPFLARWHPRLNDWEQTKPRTRTNTEHEALFPQISTLNAELAVLQNELASYAAALAKVARLPSAE